MMKRIFFVLALMAAGTALRAQSLGGEYRLKRIVPVAGRQGNAPDTENAWLLKPFLIMPELIAASVRVISKSGSSLA